jgi:hypothetical protein
MKDKKDANNEKENTEKKKKSYIKPVINTEELIGFGASCNGSVGGGRKATTGVPNFCKAGRLLS